MKTASLPKIVCIGGGTGTFVVLKGLKQHPCKLSAVVSMSDSGGSNKRIRDEFGLLPTSDIRQCLVALSDENKEKGLLRKLFMYRFEKGEGISGMTFGNLFMAALSDILGSQEEAIRQTGKVLRIHGSVIPVSFTKTNLTATYEDGTTLNEEHVIDEPDHEGSLKITKLTLDPPATANTEAIAAIQSADCVILGPGDLYTSVLPNLLVTGIPEAIKQTSATVVYIMNLMTKYGQTYNFSAADHLRVLEEYLGKRINVVVVNNSTLPKEALDLYAKYQELPVVDDLDEKGNTYTIVRDDVASSVVTTKSSSDVLIRSLIRHDSEKLASVLVSILEKTV
ncbi:MAG: gluconeogenesis factor YvcK family protein [Microgenomates group bacterium]